MDEDFSFSVEDRQELKIIEDKVIDLQTIIATLSNNIKGVRKHCQSSCQVYCKQAQRGTCACDAISEKFDSYLEEVQLCMKRANALRDMVFSSAQLVSTQYDPSSTLYLTFTSYLICCAMRTRGP